MAAVHKVLCNVTLNVWLKWLMKNEIFIMVVPESFSRFSFFFTIVHSALDL